MLLTIQIVNYNSFENLKNCLNSIRDNAPENLVSQVIIINNDGKTVDFSNVPKHPFDIEIIETGKNLGFGRAHNLGAWKARGKYILFLNPDTRVLPESLRRLVDVLEADKRAGIAGPLLVGESGFSEEEHCGFQKTPFSLIKSKIYQSGWSATEITEVDWLSGGAMMIRRELFEKLGGFDENYFMYFEDVDLCLRAGKKGYKAMVEPKAKIFHQSGRSFSDSRRKKKYYYDSQGYYIKKNFGLLWAWIVKILRLPFYVKNVWLG